MDKWLTPAIVWAGTKRNSCEKGSTSLQSRPRHVVPLRPIVHYNPAMSTPEPARTSWGNAPSLDDIAAMARAALDTLEEPFRTHARAVAIKVEDFADDETLETMKIENPYDLTGLYSGVALTLEQVSAPSQVPPMVWLYRLPILDEWAATEGLALEELVAHVVIHELGHHFGWSDEEMDVMNASDD
jgi:predicted Zn-dependent protease with MMP-like domain